MKICADFNNTITDNPDFFKGMDDLYIVSGTPESDRSILEAFLAKHEIVYKALHLCPFTWTNPHEYHKSKEWKLKIICSLKPDIYLDDSLREIMAVQKKCEKVCGLLMIKPTYRRWFKY